MLLNQSRGAIYPSILSQRYCRYGICLVLTKWLTSLWGLLPTMNLLTISYNQIRDFMNISNETLFCSITFNFPRSCTERLHSPHQGVELVKYFISSLSCKHLMNIGHGLLKSPSITFSNRQMLCSSCLKSRVFLYFCNNCITISMDYNFHQIPKVYLLYSCPVTIK